MQLISIWDQQANNPDEDADGEKDLSCLLGMISLSQHSSIHLHENSKEESLSCHMVK